MASRLGMSLPLVIALAILLPAALFLAILLFAKGTSWFASRPRVWGMAMIVFGTVYAAGGLWNGRDGFNTEEMLFVAGGALFAGGGVYHWFRAKPVDLE